MKYLIITSTLSALHASVWNIAWEWYWFRTSRHLVSIVRIIYVLQMKLSHISATEATYLQHVSTYKIHRLCFVPLPDLRIIVLNLTVISRKSGGELQRQSQNHLVITFGALSGQWIKLIWPAWIYKKVLTVAFMRSVSCFVEFNGKNGINHFWRLPIDLKSFSS